MFKSTSTQASASDPNLKSKQQAAEAVFAYLEPWIDRHTVLGIGTGSTTNCFIELLSNLKGKFQGAVASSQATEAQLKAKGIETLDLNTTGTLPFYIDGADEFDPHLNLIKGGGGALTREKIVAACSDQFLCIVDQSKRVDVLGTFPLPIEVIPMARSYVGRQIVQLNGDPALRQGFLSDNGNPIIDIHHLSISTPLDWEQRLNNIPGVVSVGLFAHRGADKIFMSTASGVEVLERPQF
ncbi:MAG: ribose-5-phosphate isomerase RpiA, partial [Gammaproteobacteria bacterium]